MKGAESTLLLRSVYTTGDRDAYWDTHRAQERKRIYGNISPISGYPDEYLHRKAA